MVRVDDTFEYVKINVASPEIKFIFHSFLELSHQPYDVYL